MPLTFRPMTDDEVAAFQRDQVAVYAVDIERHAGWTKADAEAKAKKDMAANFPDGKLQPGHTLLVLEEAASGSASCGCGSSSAACGSTGS